MRASSLTFILFIFLIYSCGRQIDCPSFNKNIIKWFPYEEGLELNFSCNELDSSLTFKISKVIIEHTTHYMTDLDCGTCDDYADFSSEDLDFIVSVFLNENKITLERYEIIDSYFSSSYEYSEESDYTFNDTIYAEVKIFNCEYGNCSLKTIIIAKEEGIVGLIDKNNKIWTLSNPTNYYIEATDLQIEFSSCV